LRGIRSSILTLLLLSVSTNCSAQSSPYQDKDNRAILLKGTVTGVEPEIPSGSSSAIVKVSLKLEYVNITKNPILLLVRKSPICVDAAITKTTEPAEGDNVLFDQYREPMVTQSPEWKELRAALNRKTPLANLIKTVKPGEIWITDSFVIFRLSLTLRQYEIGLPASSWSLLLQSSPEWLRLICKLWPLNVEPDPWSKEHRFGPELQKRWRQHGILQLDTVKSEPFILNFRSH
jgi:hypothetical protein